MYFIGIKLISLINSACMHGSKKLLGIQVATYRTSYKGKKCMSFLHLSLLLIHFFLTLSILPSCLTLRQSATQPSIQASKLVIEKTCNRKSQHHPTKFKFPYRRRRLQSVGSNNMGYWSSSIREGNNLDRVFYCKIWFYRGAEILSGSYLAVEGG
jgi:hypothetical protein